MKRLNDLYSPLSLRSTCSFTEVVRLVATRLEELVVELGVPLGNGTSDVDPLLVDTAKVGQTLLWSGPD